MRPSHHPSLLWLFASVLFCPVFSLAEIEDFGIEEVPQLGEGDGANEDEESQEANELALNELQNSPKIFQREVFPGFNEIYLADPLTLPRNFLAGYDPKKPTAHLDEKWQDKFVSLHEASKFFIAQQQLTNAIHTLRQALLIAPDVAQSRYLLGNCYQQLGLTQEARAEYSRILTHFPDFTPARASRSQASMFAAFQIEKKAKEQVVSEAELTQKQSYLVEAIRDSELLIESLQLAMRERPINQVQFEKQAHFFNFQIYLCQLGLEDEEGARRNLSRYSPLDQVPTWYFMKAASALNELSRSAQDSELEKEATKNLQSARNIYPPQDLNSYQALLQDIGWL